MKGIIETLAGVFEGRGGGWQGLRLAHLSTLPQGTVNPEAPGLGIGAWREPLVLSGAGRGGGSGEDRGGGGKDAYHIPVLADEVVHFLEPGPDKLIVDGTLGGGGHTRRLLERGASVLGLDQDAEAIEHVSRALGGEAYFDKLAMVRCNFREFPSILEASGVVGVDGILVDLGVSSHQLDESERGFSFQSDGPLDMRMDGAAELTAADLVNGLEEAPLADLFYEYGEERASRRIAKAVVEARRLRRIETTLELARVVESVLPRRGKSHPATKVFQALRIVVNDELGALREMLESSVKWLRPGGRLAVITFHSLEDRMVKRFIRDRSAEWLDKPEWPEPKRNPDFSLKPVIRRALAPSPEEQKRN
ncbi:MAG: 16S rRNA (cytosine(1402)-N(4))-methyltransferase RsmH, partial [Verrucomicrobiales bacterium]|nr:16S rRNA (cytosine(1402)-N(4))-methyltransferase RsmH [Verrucomicrobiales bacterium]